MIRQASTLVRPSFRAAASPVAHHGSIAPRAGRVAFSSHHSQAVTRVSPTSSTSLHPCSPRPKRWPRQQPCRYHQSPTTRSFHYNPNPYQPPPQSGKSWLKVLRDMALGSILTIALSTAYDYYEEREFIKERIAEEEWAQKLRLDLVQEFGEARSTPIDETAGANGDFERKRKLREVTFSLPTRLVESPEDAGWLPGFPLGDELYGKERVPAEETKVYVSKDENDRITGMYVAVNADDDQASYWKGPGDPGDPGDDGTRDKGRGMAWGIGMPVMSTVNERPVNPWEWEDAAGTLLGELVARVRLQKDTWQRQDRLSKHPHEGLLVVVLYVRNWSWMFLLDGDQVKPLNTFANILT